MSLKDWQPCDPPGEWPLMGQRIVLEPLDWSVHGSALFEAVSDESIWKYMPIGPYTEYEAFRSDFEAAASQKGWAIMVIRSATTRAVLGMSTYMRLRQAHGSVEIGAVAFGKALKRTAEATEAMYLMAAHVFEELGYRRYEWKCHAKNKASWRAAERLGFVFEGVFRNDMVVRGKNRDTAWFAMTDADWPKIKAGFERWLAPGNFDAAGEQKATLEACRG